MSHGAYVLAQPSATLGRGFQALCPECGVLGHYGSQTEALVMVRAHQVDTDGQAKTKDEHTDLIFDIRRGIKHMRLAQQKIEESLTEDSFGTGHATG